MLIYKGKVIAGGGTIVMPMTRSEYEANKTVLDSADVWVDLTDEPDSIADGECIQYNSDMNFEDIGNIATKSIAKVEPSDTALYLHKVGEGFINKDGDYCITDVQISVGGTITVGTNCHVVDGGMSSNLSRVSTSVSSGRIVIEKSGNVVHVFTPSSVGLSSIEAIPAEYRPINNIVGALGLYDATAQTYKTCQGALQTDGVVRAYTEGGSILTGNFGISFSFTYII